MIYFWFNERVCSSKKLPSLVFFDGPYLSLPREYTFLADQILKIDENNLTATVLKGPFGSRGYNISIKKEQLVWWKLTAQSLTV